MSLEATGERLRRYREAAIDERCAMIEAHYAALKVEARARYELRHGPGSVERNQAEALARPFPAPRPGGSYGVGGNLSGSEYAAGGYCIGGRSR